MTGILQQKKCKKPSVSAIFMLQKPTMSQKMIYKQSHYRDRQAGVE
jgi:hypothetical protein